MAIYYISPTGNDTTGAGTIGSPWFSLNKAWTVVAPGDTVFMRGGTYTYTIQQYLTGKNGTSGNTIKIYAYTGESPVITRGVTFDKSAGYHKGMVFLTANYVHIKGVRFTGMFTDDNQVDAGLYLLDVNNSIFELIKCDNNVSGCYLEGLIGSTDNVFLNSDFNDNYSDYGGSNGGNSDGLGIGYNAATTGTNLVIGCRAWNNGDDGFDSFQCFTNVVYDTCWAWHNGWVYGTNVKAGNGCGFKLGSDFPHPSPFIGIVKRRMQYCLAWDNGDPSEGGGAAGAHINEAEWSCELYNNIFYNNGVRGINFHFNNRVHYFTNNICFNNGILDVEVSGASISTTCSYTSTGLSDGGSGWTNNVTAADFISLDPTGCDGIRGVNGELPILNFLRLAPGSDLIDAGTNVGLPFTGSNPDIGAFEFGGSGNIPPVANAGSDQSITLPTSSVSLAGSGTDSDGSISSYAWTQISGGSCTIVSPSSQNTNVTGLSAGTYVFRLTVTDNLGATGSDDITITVNASTSANPRSPLFNIITVISQKYTQFGGSIPPALEGLTFPDVTNWQESPAGVWGPVTYPWPGDAAEGRTNKKIPAGQAGYIQAEYGSSIHQSTAIILSTSNTILSPYYATCQYGLYVSASGNYAVAELGVYTDTGIPAVSGDWFRIITDGTNLTAEKTSNSGGTWTPVYAYPVTTSLALFLMGSSANPGNAVFLLNPKGYNIIA